MMLMLVQIPIGERKEGKEGGEGKGREGKERKRKLNDINVVQMPIGPNRSQKYMKAQ